MDSSFWIFLSVAVFMGILLPIIAIVLKHKSSMKQLEIEALKLKKANLQLENEDAAR